MSTGKLFERAANLTIHKRTQCVMPVTRTSPNALPEWLNNSRQ